MSNHDLRSKIEEIHDKVISMKPKLDDVADSMKLMELRQRSVEKTMVSHDIDINESKKDIDGLSKKIDSVKDDVKDLHIKQVMSAAANGESERWTSFLAFIVGLPKYLKVIGPWVATILSLVIAGWMAIYEYLRHRIHP